MVSTAISREQGQTDEGIDARRLLWAGPLTALVAAVANAIVFFLARAAGAVPDGYMMPNINQALTLGPVVGATFIQVLLGAVVFALIGRFAQRPIRLFRIIALVVLILSFFQPILLLAGAPASFLATLVPFISGA